MTKIAAAATLLATFGLASAANAFPPHHRHCVTQVVHHHRVTRCH
jgi:hypothetical protein